MHVCMHVCVCVCVCVCACVHVCVHAFSVCVCVRVHMRIHVISLIVIVMSLSFLCLLHFRSNCLFVDFDLFIYLFFVCSEKIFMFQYCSLLHV